MELMITISRGGILGALVGVLLVVWVRPATMDGQILLVLLCVGIFIVLAAVAKLAGAVLFRGKGAGKE